jgi:hypothetical protein
MAESPLKNLRTGGTIYKEVCRGNRQWDKIETHIRSEPGVSLLLISSVIRYISSVFYTIAANKRNMCD